MKKFFNIITSFILVIFFVTGCSEQSKYGHFEKAAELNQPRYDHTATLLPDGNVLIAGGHYQWGDLNSAEIYLTKENRFVRTGSLNIARSNQLAIPLKNGNVLFFGGTTNDDHLGTATVESYNSQTNEFTIVGHLLSKRFDPQGVLLDDGRVFVYGGAYPKAGYAEIYDPITNKSKYTSPLNLSRSNFALTKLKDGKILIIDGSMSGLCDGKIEKKVHKMSLSERKKYGLTAELYDPKTDTFKLIFGLNKYRNGNAAGGAAAITLPDGKVILVGGDDQDSNYNLVQVPEVEMYNSKTNKFSIIGKINYPSINPKLNLIDDKYVLIIITNSKHKQVIYDIKNNKFEETDNLKYPRRKFTATTLNKGNILIVGGIASYDRVNKSEIFKFNNITGISK